MYEDQQFQLISKALMSTQKSLEEQNGIESPAALQISHAREELKKAVAHAASIDHQFITNILFDQ